MGVTLILLSFSAIAKGSVTDERSLYTKLSYSVDYLKGEGDVEGIKVAFQYHTTYLKKYSDKLKLYWETSFNFWEYGRENIHDSNFVLAISPVLQYPILRNLADNLYFEGGIGISFLDDTQFAGKNVSTHYQFEDRIGLLYQFGRARVDQIALRYFHYSNAGIKKPNPGLDFISVSYMHRF